MIPVVSKNTNELQTHAPGRFVLDVSTLGSPMEARILVMSTPSQPLTLLVVAIATSVGIWTVSQFQCGRLLFRAAIPFWFVNFV